MKKGKYVLGAIGVLVVELVLAFTSPDFHVAALIIQLLIPLEIILGIICGIVAFIIMLVRKGFFTKRILMIIFIFIALASALGGLARTYIQHKTNKSLEKYPDIIFQGKTFDPPEEMTVHWYSQENKLVRETGELESDTLDDESILKLIDNPDDLYVEETCFDSDGNFYYMLQESEDFVYSVYKVDIETKEVEMLFEEPWIDDFQVSPVDSNLIYYNASGQLKLFDVTSGTSSLVVDNIGNGTLINSHGIVRISVDGRYIMYCMAIDYDFLIAYDCVYVYDVEEDTTQKVIKTKMCDIEADSLEWSYE